MTVYNRKLTAIVLAVLIFTCKLVYADPVSINQVRKVAEIHSRFGRDRVVTDGAPAYMPFSPKTARPLSEANNIDAIAYVVPLSPKGFIVISGDDTISPVIAYSFESDFPFEESEDNLLLNMLRKDLSQRIELLPLTSNGIKTKNKLLWEEYLNDKWMPEKLKDVQQWPAGVNNGWLTTVWHQSSPYNDMCPIDPQSTNRTLVGCTATAMAQIVNYHKYPKTIELDSSYAYTTTSRGIVINSFSDVNEKLADIDYEDTRQAYAPALSYVCGIITKMDFTSQGSAAWFYERNFTADLGYQDADELLESATSFYTIMVENMKSERPALISIYKTPSKLDGHAIVVDGYRETGEYHLNFGWGATSPADITLAWYSIPSGMPASYTVIHNGVLNITSPVSNPYNTEDHSVSYPNPFSYRSIGLSPVVITTPSMPDGTIEEIKIYTASGVLVRSVSDVEGHKIEWDGLNARGNKCVPGLYFYSIRTSEEGVYRGKITISN